jgi:HD-GYP domain-containing protein (c-di-GMP phosphodiesterase class II)
MPSRVKVFVGCVAVLAIGAAVAFYAASPSISPTYIAAAAVLSALAMAGELLGFPLPRSAIGAIGFIPYFAAAILVPGWPSILGVALVRTALEMTSTRPFLKRTLNISAHALMEAVVVGVYLALGGSSLLVAVPAMTLTQVSAHLGPAAIVAFALGILANNLIVFTAIALSSGRRLMTVWFENQGGSLMLDLLTTPLVFVFAWVYAAFGVIAAAALWLPILGLRHVHRINLELEATNEELLELMVKSLEARDAYTSGHSRRVQQYSLIIARAVGLTERQIRHVARASLLHDVGKIHEKYAAVLAKTDKLTPEEWGIIKEHPADGANLVSTMTRLRDIVPAIRSHHENWDGTGYPDGLAGDLIPLASRIIRFADTIDAMISERPYRAPMSEAQVRAEIVKCRGTQFDPQIADRLLSSSLWATLFPPSTPQQDAGVRAPLAVIGGSGYRAAGSQISRGA